MMTLCIPLIPDLHVFAAPLTTHDNGMVGHDLHKTELQLKHYKLTSVDATLEERLRSALKEKDELMQSLKIKELEVK